MWAWYRQHAAQLVEREADTEAAGYERAGYVTGLRAVNIRACSPW
jgi:hypothetical protein